MSSIVLLTRLQITEMIGGLRASLEKRTGADGVIAATAILALLAMGGLGYFGSFAYGFLGSPSSPKAILDILFLAVGTLTFIFSLPIVLSSFFGASDINDLLPLPVSPLSIVFSKALGALTSSYLWTFIFLAGPLAGWGIASGAGPVYWIAYLFAVLFAPLMPTAYSGILSILIASAFKRLRRKDAITTITTVLSLAFALLINFAFTSISNSNTDAATVVNNMADSMGGIVMAFPAYGFLIYAFEHLDPLGIVLYIAISLASFALFVFVARVLYLRIITSITASGARSAAYDKSQAQEASSSLKSLLSCEVKKIARNSSVALNYVVYPAVVTPAVLVVATSSGSLSSLIDNPDFDLYALGPLILAALMFFVVIATSGNKLSITSISRDGSNWIQAKFLPIPTSTQLLARVIPGFAVNAFITLAIFVAAGIGLVGSGLSVVALVCTIVMMLGYSWLSNCMGLHYDCSTPRIDWGNDGDVNIKTLGGGAGTFRCFALGMLYVISPALNLIFKLDGTLLMAGLAVVSGVLSIVGGNMLLKAAARQLETLE